MKAIILTSDFSAAAENETKYAFGLASTIGLTIELLNVFELPIITAIGADITWSKKEYDFMATGAVRAMD